MTTDYSTYNTNKLRYALNATRKQIAKLQNTMIEAQKQLETSSKKHAQYLEKEAAIRKELNLKLPMPNEETQRILDNDFVIARGISHKEFMESLDNDEVIGGFSSHEEFEKFLDSETN